MTRGHPSARRCLLLTHAVMGPTLYGWALQNIEMTTRLVAPIDTMMATSLTMLANTPSWRAQMWVSKRLECLCEITYVYLLQAQAGIQALSYADAIMRVDPILCNILSMARAPKPGFLPPQMRREVKAHSCLTVIQLLTALPGPIPCPPMDSDDPKSGIGTKRPASPLAEGNLDEEEARPRAKIAKGTPATPEPRPEVRAEDTTEEAQHHHNTPETPAAPGWGTPETPQTRSGTGSAIRRSQPGYADEASPQDALTQPWAAARICR